MWVVDGSIFNVSTLTSNEGSLFDIKAAGILEEKTSITS